MTRPAANGRAMRALVLGAVLALAGPLAAAQGDYDFRISRPPDRTAEPGTSFDVKVQIAHTCPVTGVARLLVQGDRSIAMSATEAVWGDCGSDGYARASADVHFDVFENATAGLHALGIAAVWEGHTAAVGMAVTVPYVASVDLAGPAATPIAPGHAVPVTLDLVLTSNGDTDLVFGTDAPSGWTVGGLRPIHVDVVDGEARLQHRLQFTAPADGRGDVPITITALPMYSVGRQESGAPGVHVWKARLPPRVEPEPPAEDPDAPGDTHGDDAGTLPLAPPPPPDEGLPPWAIAVLLVGFGALAMWWTRRK